jgi:hypothetical protein
MLRVFRVFSVFFFAFFSYPLALCLRSKMVPQANSTYPNRLSSVVTSPLYSLSPGASPPRRAHSSFVSLTAILHTYSMYTTLKGNTGSYPFTPRPVYLHVSWVCAFTHQCCRVPRCASKAILSPLPPLQVQSESVTAPFNPCCFVLTVKLDSDIPRQNLVGRLDKPPVVCKFCITDTCTRKKRNR